MSSHSTLPTVAGARASRRTILKGLGVRSGVPDVIAIKAGQTYALELKAPGGQVTAAQRAAHVALRAAGASVAVAYGVDAAIEQLERWELVRGSFRGIRP
jgi:predicted RecB family endonuclease